MSVTPVVWVDYPAPGKGIARGYWDQSLVEALLAGEWGPVASFAHHIGFEAAEAAEAVVVVPGRFHAADTARLNADLARYRSVVLIVTSDEESLFPWREVSHPDLRWWVMTPRPEIHADLDARWIGEGYQPGTPSMVRAVGRDLDWYFAGQITHPRRLELARVLRGLDGGHLIETAGFAAGVDQGAYLGGLCRAKVAPAPAGPATPDSFRVYEALEAGAVPVVEERTGTAAVRGYWAMVLGDDHPLPVVEHWRELGGIIESVVDAWPARSNQVRSWWARYRRRLGRAFACDLDAIGADLARPDVTVLMPTSPIPSHPDTSVIEATIASVRERLPTAEIIVMCDGVRSEQSDRRASWEAYLERLFDLRLDVVPVVFGEHLHQAEMTRRTLDDVDTPLVLFVEHDTPLVGEVDFDALAAPLLADELDLIRLHYGTEIGDYHRHMMLGAVYEACGVPVQRTVQWSQRPHLARTDYYRRVLAEHFRPEGRTMIEDVMHGRAQEGDWSAHRLAIYHPAGSIERSTHLDGRGDDPKYEMEP